MADQLSIARTFDDAHRITLATRDGARMIGPLETSKCSHAATYSFRYEWPKGSGGPKDGECVLLENKCVDCALQGWLRPGTRIAI